MSKTDAVRALREARYAQDRAAARPAARTTRATSSTRAAQPATAQPATAEPATDEPAADELCGHRNISGRTCTRERGHAAKTHRYS